MRVLLIVGWLFVGLSGVIYHFGPGKQQQKLDNVGSELTLARAEIQNRD